MVGLSTLNYMKRVLTPLVYCFEIPRRDFEAVAKIKINPPNQRKI